MFARDVSRKLRRPQTTRAKKPIAGEEGGFCRALELEPKVANNRMYFKNKRTGAEVLIAKYYPSTGWTVFHEGLGQRIDNLLRENEAPRSAWGDNDWEIEYEMTTAEVLEYGKKA
jgi:hypothetical protein